MVQGVDGVPRIYKNTWDAMKKIYKAEGVLGFYKGIWPNYFKVSMTTANAGVVVEGGSDLMRCGVY